MENKTFKDVLFKALAEDFAKAVSEYRKARQESDLPTNFSYDDEEREENYRAYDKRIEALKTSKDYISLTREEYWQQILKAKIEVIASIDGFKMMQDFCTYLCNIPDDDLNLYSAFDYYADGIKGWCR